MQGRVVDERSGGEVEASRSRLATLFNRRRLSSTQRRLARYITDHPREAPFPQPSRKIDTKLARPLTDLPGMPAGFEFLAVWDLLTSLAPQPTGRSPNSNRRGRDGAHDGGARSRGDGVPGTGTALVLRA